MADKRIPCEVFVRVVGYYRPINQMNAGKKEEQRERILLRVPEEVKREHVEAI